MFLLILSLVGCASNGSYPAFVSSATDARQIEDLPSVPFFPQQAFHCGPAALATVLNAAGAHVTPDQLAPQVFIEGRQGSLQLELKAASRRHGFLAYQHDTGFAGLLHQLETGTPVLVLQNLGLGWAPTWHYAVVVGYLPQRQKVVLRSGSSRLKQVSLKEFERTWRYSQYWALTVHPPGTFPAGAEPLPYLSAVSDLEAVGELPSAQTAYAAATREWPDNVVAWMGLGNVHYQLQHYQDAEQAYRQALNLAPATSAPNHNLAWALIRQGQSQQAWPYAQQAADLAGSPDSPYRSALDALLSSEQDLP